MDNNLLEKFDALPFPARKDIKLHEMLRHLPVRDFSNVRPGQFTAGISLEQAHLIPETALASLRKGLSQAGIHEREEGIPLRVHIDAAFEKEEYGLEIAEDSVTISASGAEGLRYAVYEFEDALLAHDEDGVVKASIHRRPQIRHRVTRSFLSPNCRPPLMLDELEDDFDYYPDEYLDAIAHQRMNGIWITVYLNDMPCHYFPERGELAEKKLGKLRSVIAKCARYGIKCYLYMSEPRSFNGKWKNMSKDDMARYPDMAGHVGPDGTRFFCTSSEDGQGYLRETIGHVARNAPGLGGIINIMCCETTWPCATWKLYPHVQDCNCPRCAPKTAAQLFSSMARLMNDALRKYQPEAVFIGWFYAASYIPGDPENRIINEIAREWPEDIPMMRNCETGGRITQMGREVIVEDYSLSYGRASQPWKEMASHLKRPAAKIQTCSSHEDATVPYLPVPGRLYNIYKDLFEYHCEVVMQSWYFGNYPCLMSGCAGRLSFSPLPGSELELLEELARPVWGGKSRDVALCWKMFSDAYANFPEILTFKWFGPLHSSIVFPWYLVPRDLPMAPSYTQNFPKNSGDRVYECISYVHTPQATLELMERMEAGWSEALQKLEKIAVTEEQLSQLEIAKAVEIQIKSTCNLLKFYSLREKMIFRRVDCLPEIREVVRNEIGNTLAMLAMCRKNELLGYHAEVESYMFYPEKLEMRAKLLQNLLENDCAEFDLDSQVLRAYRGDDNLDSDRHLGDSFRLGGLDVSCLKDADGNVRIECQGDIRRVTLYLEPGRICHIICFTVDNEKKVVNEPVPGLKVEKSGRGYLCFTIDMNAFAPFRQLPEQPLRFNMVCNGEALSELHPLPMRLHMGTVNSADLVWLKF